jgi:hypothetical protein
VDRGASDVGVWVATGLQLLARIITSPLLPKPGFPDQNFRLAALHVGELMRKVAFLGALALVAALISLGSGPVRATARAQHVNSVGGLDCNGFSLIQKPVRRGMLCTEIAANTMHGFEDNGNYVGHDEPAAEFFSSKRGSGGSESYQVKLPVEPAKKPNGSFTGPVWTFQNDVTFWFGMVLCDNQSYPEGTKGLPPEQRPQHPGPAAGQPRRGGVPGGPVLPAGQGGVRFLRPEALVRGADDRQPASPVRRLAWAGQPAARDLQPQLHRAGQLRLPH